MERVRNIPVVGGIFGVISEIQRRNNLNRVTKENQRTWAVFGGPDGESVTKDDIRSLLKAELALWQAEAEYGNGSRRYSLHYLLLGAQNLEYPGGRRAAVVYFNIAINLITIRRGDRIRVEPGGSRDLEFARQITACSTAISLLTGETVK